MVGQKLSKETALLLHWLKAACVYDPVTGLLHWRRSSYMSNQWNGKYAGKEAFIHTDSQGYRDGKFMGVKLQASRVCWALYYGAWPKGDVDHKNGVRGENWIENLRDVSETANLLNAKLSKRNKTGLHGVSARGKKFVAMMHYKKKQHYLGTFNSAEEAYSARVAFAKNIGLTMLDKEAIL